MNHIRNHSLSKVNIKGWRWLVFLEKFHQLFSHYEIKSYSLEDRYLNKESNIGSIKKPVKVKLATWGFITNKIRKVRSACLQVGESISILNLVVSPHCNYDLPFFGADFVTLKNGHLIALDLQPALKNDIKHTKKVWDRILPIHQKWQSLLPHGGSIPDDAKPYFSPGFLWSRFPLGSDGDKIISEVLYEAYIEYIKLYLELLDESISEGEERSLELLKGQKNYMQYRAKKDPARGLLRSYFGEEWAESYINQVLFDLQ